MTNRPASQSTDSVLQLPSAFCISPNREFVTSVSAMLSPSYHLVPFESLSPALAAIRAADAYAIIFDLTTTSAANELVHYHGSGRLKGHGANILLTNVAGLANLPRIDWEIAPITLRSSFTQRDLLKSVSHAINRGVETSWAQLPEHPRRVLNETVAVFRSCFGALEAGEPLPMREVEEACQPLIKAVEEGQVADILDGLRNHDDYTYAHSLKVSIYLSLLGKRLGLARGDLMNLAKGGLLHDIGKSQIRLDILNKPGRLNDEEMELMRTHVDHTARIFDQNPGIEAGVRIIALQHHEKIDGSGYPLGLKGEQLNNLARMAAIADVFGALTDRRAYKSGMDPNEAIAIMQGMDGHLDQHMIGLFQDALLLDDDVAASVN